MSRLDKIKEQHPDLNISLIDIISFLDPTDSYKYLDFLVKNFKNDNDYYSPNKEEFMGYMGVFLFGSGKIETLNEFERHSRLNRIQNKDISSYKNFLELHEVVKKADEIEKRKQLEKEILKIHEDDTWLVLTPLTFESSKVYGSNTKWCVTQEKYWVNYLSTHRLVYVLNKKTDTKIAFSRNFRLDYQKNRNPQIQAWDQLDKEVDPMFINFIPDELFLKIRKELQENKTTGDLIGWGDDVSTIRRRISDYSEPRTANDIVQETLRIWSSTNSDAIINPTNNDSRRAMFSNDMIERIKRLIGSEQNQTVSGRPDVNYNIDYSDDLP